MKHNAITTLKGVPKQLLRSNFKSGFSQEPFVLVCDSLVYSWLMSHESHWVRIADNENSEDLGTAQWEGSRYSVIQYLMRLTRLCYYKKIFLFGCPPFWVIYTVGCSKFAVNWRFHHEENTTVWILWEREGHLGWRTCEKYFASPLILRRHIESVHKWILYRCTYMKKFSVSSQPWKGILEARIMNVTFAKNHFHAKKILKDIKNHAQQKN